MSQVLVYSFTVYFRQLCNERQNSVLVAVIQLLHLLVTSFCNANIKTVLIWNINIGAAKLMSINIYNHNQLIGK
jgi:hypothetical protein